MNPWTHVMNQSRPPSETIVVFIVGSSSFCFWFSLEPSPHFGMFVLCGSPWTHQPMKPWTMNSQTHAPRAEAHSQTPTSSHCCVVSVCLFLCQYFSWGLESGTWTSSYKLWRSIIQRRKWEQSISTASRRRDARRVDVFGKKHAWCYYVGFHSIVLFWGVIMCGVIPFY